jgi:hypothetical protein
VDSGGSSQSARNVRVLGYEFVRALPVVSDVVGYHECVQSTGIGGPYIFQTFVEDFLEDVGETLACPLPVAGPIGGLPFVGGLLEYVECMRENVPLEFGGLDIPGLGDAPMGVRDCRPFNEIESAPAGT